MLHVTLGTVHPGVVAYDWHQSMMRTTHHAGMSTNVISVQSGPLIARARNQVHALFLENSKDASHLMWTDSDIVWNPEDILTLAECDVPIVSGLYYSKDHGTIFPVFTVQDPEHGLIRGKEPPAHLDMVHGVGMGFCLIKREVIEDLGTQTLFPFAEVDTPEMSTGEDITFCIRARQAGHETWLNPAVRVGHRKAVIL